MSVIINPGTGPVPDATQENAELCIEQFILDLGLDGVTSEFVKPCHGLESTGTWPDIAFREGPPDGRFEFALTRGEYSVPVEMPGLPVEKVRYLGRPQSIWDYPRLYVDGSSWVWCFAINSAVGALTGEDEEE